MVLVGQKLIFIYEKSVFFLTKFIEAFKFRRVLRKIPSGNEAPEKQLHQKAFWIK